MQMFLTFPQKKYMRFCYLSFVLVLICGWFNSLPAQVQNLTSLKDTTLAALYLKKGKALTGAAKYDSSTFYFEAAKSIYEKLAQNFNLENINVNTVQCYNWIGWNLGSQGKYDDSIRQLNQALDIGLKKLGEIHGVIAQKRTKATLRKQNRIYFFLGNVRNICIFAINVLGIIKNHFALPFN